MVTTLKNSKTGLVESAQAAYRHRPDGHVCVGCDVPMCPMQSSKGQFFARLYPGKKHVDGCPCTILERNKRIIDIEITDSEFFDRSIMTSISKRIGGDSGGHPGPPKADKESVTCIRSLRHLFQLGLCNARDFALNASTKLSDILLNRFTLHTVMRNNACVGPKAIVAKPDFVIRSSMTIRFCAFAHIKRRGVWVKASKVFDLRFCDKELFTKYMEKLFLVERTETGSERYISRYHSVLIYGHWIALSMDVCNNGICRRSCTGSWPCTGYQYAECPVPAHQIYCPPKNKVKK